MTDTIEFDGAIPGFGLRTRAGGSRTWIFQYKIGAKQRRMVIGKAAAFTPAKARKIAGDLYAAVRLGVILQAIERPQRFRWRKPSRRLPASF